MNISGKAQDFTKSAIAIPVNVSNTVLIFFLRSAYGKFMNIFMETFIKTFLVL